MHSLILKIVVNLKSVQISNFAQSKLSIYLLNISSVKKVIWLSVEKNQTQRTEIPKIFTTCLSINNVVIQKSWWKVVSDPVFPEKAFAMRFHPTFGSKESQIFIGFDFWKKQTSCSLEKTYVNLIWFSSCEFQGICSASLFAASFILRQI